MAYYMKPKFADNFTDIERNSIKNDLVYGQEEHWHLLLALACVLAFFVLLIQCLSCVGTFKQAKGKVEAPRMIEMGVCFLFLKYFILFSYFNKLMQERFVEIFGAILSFIGLITVAIRLSDIYRYDPVCGIYECEFRSRLITVAVRTLTK
jgi:hypothetical protein